MKPNLFFGGQDNEKFIKFKLGSGPTKKWGAGQNGGKTMRITVVHSLLDILLISKFFIFIFNMIFIINNNRILSSMFTNLLYY